MSIFWLYMLQISQIQLQCCHNYILYIVNLLLCIQNVKYYNVTLISLYFFFMYTYVYMMLDMYVSHCTYKMCFNICLNVYTLLSGISYIHSLVYFNCVPIVSISISFSSYLLSWQYYSELYEINCHDTKYVVVKV